MTGDLYSLNHERDEWIPCTNVGLHYKRAALEFNSIGKYVVKSPVYVPKKLNEDIVVRDMNEVVCRLKKHISGHWLFQGCDPDFVVYCETKWQVHPFSFIDKNKVFKELASSKDGPMIIEFQNIIAVQFDIKKRYSSSIAILKNFISAKLRRLVEDAQATSILDYRSLQFSDPATRELVFKPKNKISDHLNDRIAARRTRGFRLSGEPIVGSLKQPTEPLKKKLGGLFESTNNNGMFVPPTIDLSPFKHSGYASTQKGPLIVEKNNICNEHILVKKNPLKDGSIGFGIANIQAKFREQFLQRSETMEERFKTKSPGKGSSMNTSQIHRGGDTSENTIPLNASAVVKTTMSNQQHSVTLSRSEIRRALYPQLDEDYVKNQTAWVLPTLFVKGINF